jgi:hypothetical protein
MIQLTPTSSTANRGSARPRGTGVPEPKLPTRCAGVCCPGFWQAFELDRCRRVVPSCTRSSRGVAARPVSNLVSSWGPVPSGRGRLGAPVRDVCCLLLSFAVRQVPPGSASPRPRCGPIVAIRRRENQAADAPGAATYSSGCSLPDPGRADPFLAGSWSWVRARRVQREPRPDSLSGRSGRVSFGRLGPGCAEHPPQSAGVGPIPLVGRRRWRGRSRVAGRRTRCRRPRCCRALRSRR